jgi:photosystem II stability/assembly factor-like uncharacterized protein
MLQPARSETKSRALQRRRVPGQRPTPSSGWLPLSIAACLLVGAGFATYKLRTPEPVLEPKVIKIVETPRPVLGVVEMGAVKRDLHDGDAVRTPAGATALIRWNDGTKFTLGADTGLDRLSEGDKGKTVLLVRGTVSAEVTPQPAGRSLVFTTPHGEARVVGTTLSLRVDLDAKKGTRLDVQTGKVELQNGSGKSVLVEAGYFAIAATGRELASKKIETPGWKNITSDLGGATWGNGGVTLLAPVPGRDEILAGVGYRGLWSTVDGGESWKQIGEPMDNMPHHLVFDPVNPRTFWVSAIYGPGLFRTMDGGASFKQLGGLKHIDGLAVDFSDPMRRTLLVTKHLDAGGLQKSTDGGESWTQIGDRLPADSSSSSMPFILDSKTYLVDASGTIGKTEGIYRSADAGQTWTRVSKILSAGPPLLASDGSLYWMSKAGMGSGVQKSTDRGLTWTMLPGPVRNTPVEIPGGRLVSVFEQQMYVSANGGASWEKFGEPVPVKAQRTFTGMTYEMAAYSDARRAIYVWRGGEKVGDAVFRWNLPE